MQTYPCWHCTEKDKRIAELKSTLQQYLDNADARMVRGFNFDTGEYPVTAETISVLCAEKQQLQAKLDAAYKELRKHNPKAIFDRAVWEEALQEKDDGN